MNSEKWNTIIRAVNDDKPRTEVEKYLTKEEMKIYDKTKADLIERRKTNPKFCFWSVETDW